MKKTVLKWEMAGIAFVFLAGALLHFVFEWSGEAATAGAIASVNESVWEHFKQGFWPMILWAIIELRFLTVGLNTLLVGKAAAVYLIPAVTGLAFYAYTAVIGEEFLVVDILIFLVAIAVGQWISYRLLTSRRFSRYAGVGASAAIALLGLALVLFTFHPPELPIFRDPTGVYGIP